MDLFPFFLIFFFADSLFTFRLKQVFFFFHALLQKKKNSNGNAQSLNSFFRKCSSVNVAPPILPSCLLFRHF